MMRRLTTAQAIIRFLKAQCIARDGEEHSFFAGCFGIFGHGNVAGIGQALQESRDFPYYLCRNEQAMVHTAAALDRKSTRLNSSHGSNSYAVFCLKKKNLAKINSRVRAEIPDALVIAFPPP